MKKVKLMLVFIFTMNILQSQVKDSLTELRLTQLETNTKILQSNLAKCHKQWIHGGGLNIAGVGFMGIGTWLLVETTTNPIRKDPTVGYCMIGAGGILSLIGTIVMLDSHKYIGNSGLSIQNGGIVYKFK